MRVQKQEIGFGAERDRRSLLTDCVGSLSQYCSASPMHPAAKYVAAPLIGIGIAPAFQTQTLATIVAFDRAEASFANITQTNMVRVSSFNGLNGLLLGLDLLPQPLEPSGASAGIEVFRAEPLFEATRKLLGTVEDRRFPIAPGQHLLCAYKAHHAPGPCHLYGSMAIAIPEDRTKDADLFMEDHGTLAAEDLPRQVEGLRQAMLDSVRAVGENLRVRYRHVFLSVQLREVPDGHIGCALTAAPYIQLARNAVPEEGVGALAAMSVGEWERQVSHRFVGGVPPVHW